MNENTPETAHEQKYKQKFNDWSNQVVFRMAVYMMLIALTTVQFGITTKLAEEGILPGDVQGFKFVYYSLIVFLTGLLCRDITRGLSYSVIRAVGKHRLFAVVSVGVALFFGLSWADPQTLTGDHAEAYVTMAWAFAVLIGLEPLEGAIFERDADRLRSVLPGVSVDG